MSALSMLELAKSFRAGTSGCSATVSVLRGVNLTLWPGDVVALCGARGSGKSTLLRCAAGLLRPDSGLVL
ncbi:MAG TPA: ATP-binding cassette domain-containing protein [Steroidobacteraceae bacterium]